jgi:hypothetical protein
MGQVAIPVEPSPRLPSEARCTDLFGSSVEETITPHRRTGRRGRRWHLRLQCAVLRVDVVSQYRRAPVIAPNAVTNPMSHFALAKECPLLRDVPPHSAEPDAGEVGLGLQAHHGEFAQSQP